MFEFGVKTAEELVDYILTNEYEIDEIWAMDKFLCGCIDTSFAIFNVADLQSVYFNEETLGYYIVDTMLITINDDVEFGCPECASKFKLEKTYCDECDRPKGFDDSIRLYHSVTAYCTNADDTDEDIINRIQGVIDHPEWQICCSTRPIENIGILVKADVLVASNKDLCSLVEKDTGRRYFEKNTWKNHIISHANQLDESIWSHTEIVTSNNKPYCVWVSKYASNEEKRFALKLARLFQLDYDVVGNVHYINR